jgi:hypothetical protein
LIDYGLRVLSHVVDWSSSAAWVLNGGADLKRQLFFFFSIGRNWRGWTEDDLASTGFLCLRGGSANILRLLCELLNRTMGGRVRRGPEIHDKDV